MQKKGSPPPKSLKKKVKFEESKSSDKVDMTGWVVPAGCEPYSKTCRARVLEERPYLGQLLPRSGYN